MNQTVTTRSMTPLQTAAALVAVVFLVVGAAGFVPGLTMNADELEFSGHESGAELLGLFQVSVLHNVVHLLFGVVGLGLARSWSGARAFLIGGGLIYAVLFVYGIAIDHHSDANFVPLNGADNVLHLVLAVAMVSVGVLLGRSEGGRRVA
jgi:hypothetical protein